VRTAVTSDADDPRERIERDAAALARALELFAEKLEVLALRFRRDGGEAAWRLAPLLDFSARDAREHADAATAVSEDAGLLAPYYFAADGADR
jgi:hypothetical protein